MNKVMAFLVLMWTTALFAAAEVKSTAVGVIAHSECQLVAKDSSIVGTTVGGTVGAAAGAVLGRAIFGKSGGWVGGLIGGAAGGAVGNNVSATETFQCKLIVNTDGKQYMVQSVTNEKPKIGDKVTVVEMDDGTREVM
ncbi:TPA: glycine zipper 2TM domain-containing protein [Pseudomonas aeruginosa]